MQMNLRVSVFGPDILQGHEVTIGEEVPTLQNLAAALLKQGKFPWQNVFSDDQHLMEGYTALINGRNIGSLDGFKTRLQENDQIIFTVIISGG